MVFVGYYLRMGGALSAYFDASVTDRLLMSLTRAPGSGEFVFVVDFDGLLDADALRTAWYETLRRHPIVACHRGGTGRNPRWVPAEADRTNAPLVGGVTMDNSRWYTRLRLTLDHGAMDGRGGLYVLETLRDRYRFRSETRSADYGARTFRGVIDAVGFPEVRARRAVQASNARWSGLATSSHVREESDNPMEGAEVLRYELGARGSSRLQQFARATGTPMTAAIAAALSVAWERASREDTVPRVGGWLVTNDLRPALGYAGGLGNLSGIDAISFASGAAGLRAAMNAAKTSYDELRAAGGGIASQVLGEQSSPLLRLPGASVLTVSSLAIMRQRARYSRILSNLGRVPDALLAWGDASIRDLYVVPPLKGLPYDVFAVSSFAGSLSVVIRLAGSTLTGAFFAKFRAALHETFGEAANLLPEAVAIGS